jgi:hypothetical protein
MYKTVQIGLLILFHSFTFTDITISYKNRPIHAYIINTTLLALCCSNMFQPSKGHLQSMTDRFPQQDKKMCNRYKIQFSEQCVG